MPRPPSLTASVLILLLWLAFPAHADAALVRSLTEETIARASALDASQAARDTVVNYLELATAAAVPDDVRARLMPVVERMALATVERDPARWLAYGLRPLDVVSGPRSVLYEPLHVVVDRQLEAALAEQDTDGAWRPTWSWSGAYPEAWPQAEAAWKGVLTLEMLARLRAFGRLPPSAR